MADDNVTRIHPAPSIANPLTENPWAALTDEQLEQAMISAKARADAVEHTMRSLEREAMRRSPAKRLVRDALGRTCREPSPTPLHHRPKGSTVADDMDMKMLVAGREAVRGLIARAMPELLPYEVGYLTACLFQNLIRSVAEVKAEALEAFAESLDEEDAGIDIALGGAGHVIYLARARAAAYRTSAPPNSEEADRV